MRRIASCLSLFALLTLAAPAGAGGGCLAPGPPVYTGFFFPPAPFVSIVGSPAAFPVFPAGVDDLMSAPIALPAPFSFYGAPKTTLQVSANGFVAFDALPALPGGFFLNDPPAFPPLPNDLIAPWWDDLVTEAGSSVWVGLGPASELIVEWSFMEHFPFGPSGESASFQAVLTPSPEDSITFHYDFATFAVGAGVWSATVGVEDFTGFVGTDVTLAGAGNAVFPLGDVFLEACVPCGSTESFGAPCPASIGTAGGPPFAGNASFAVIQTGAPPGVPAVLVLGLSETLLFGVIPLPFPLALFGFAGGCSLLVSADILFPTATLPIGTSYVPLPIPPAAPPCTVVYTQWIVITGPATVAASDALLIAVG